MLMGKGRARGREREGCGVEEGRQKPEGEGRRQPPLRNL